MWCACNCYRKGQLKQWASVRSYFLSPWVSLLYQRSPYGNTFVLIEDNVRATSRRWRSTGRPSSLNRHRGRTARPFISQVAALVEAVAFDGSRILCTGPVVRDGSEDLTVCDGLPGDLNTLLDSKVAAGPISAGQLITADMFVSPAELNSVSLSEAIPANKVAISIRPDGDAVSGGFVRPGDRVNIIASSNVQLNQFLDLLKDPDLRT